jgi:hypothetical protein
MDRTQGAGQKEDTECPAHQQGVEEQIEGHDGVNPPERPAAGALRLTLSQAHTGVQAENGPTWPEISSICVPGVGGAVFRHREQNIK